MAGAVVLAQNIVFRDREGNMSLSGLSSWKATRVGDAELRFIGKGSPLIATWKKQGITVRSTQIEGLAQSAGRSFSLKSTTVTGNTKIDLVGTQPGSNSRSTLTCTKAVYDAANSTVDLAGGITLASFSPESQRRFNMKGQTARLKIVSGSWPIASGTVEGPIDMTLISVRKSAGSAGTLMTMKASAQRAEFVDAQRTITLLGNVSLSGDDDLTGGTVTGVDKAIIHLNEARDVTEVELFGQPGETTYSPPIR